MLLCLMKALLLVLTDTRWFPLHANVRFSKQASAEFAMQIGVHTSR